MLYSRIFMIDNIFTYIYNNYIIDSIYCILSIE
jgi:hypothetical protein